MNYIITNQKKLLPYFIVSFFVTLFFTLNLMHPYAINWDVGFQIRALQQYIRGDSSFNTIVMPNLDDLSQNRETWIAWWPPGIQAIFYPFLKAGLSLGFAGRLISYISIISACIAWLKVAYRIDIPYIPILIFSLILPRYPIRFLRGGYLYMTTSEVVIFGITPWLFLYLIYLREKLFVSDRQQSIHTIFHCAFFSFLIGSLFWIKYSVFIVSISLFIYLLINIFSANYSPPSHAKIKLALISLFSFTLAPAILLILNIWFTGSSGTLSQAELFANSVDSKSYAFNDPNTKGLNLLLRSLMALGTNFFNYELKIEAVDNHLVETIAKTLSLNFPKYSFAILVPIVIVAILFHARNLYKIDIKLVFCILIIPVLGFAYSSSKSTYNILSEYRYYSQHIAYIDIVLIASVFHLCRNLKISLQRILLCVVMLFLIVYLANVIKGYLVRPTIIDRAINQEYITTRNEVYVPTLSNANAQSVVDRINSSTISPKDIIVLALAEPMAATLEMEHRTLTLTSFWGPLIHTYGLGRLSPSSSAKFKTSQDLRVVLVVSKFFQKENSIITQELQSRFPQAGVWRESSKSSSISDTVSIWYADLQASLN